MDIREKIELYAKNVQHYIDSNGIDEKGKPIDFKAFGASSGVYQQRDCDKFMVRPRTTGGIVDLDTIEKIYEIRQKYEGSNIRLTSRQDFQFHHISLSDSVKLMRELSDIGLYSIGTGGNTARNVAASPLSGLQSDEEFDITEYALAAGKLLSEDETNMMLPRKYKVSFSSTAYDTGNASFADLGFFARLIDGKKKFRVLGAGGLGPKPKISMVLAEEINADEALYYIEAMKQFFYNEGDRKNRARARLRHLLDKYGEEEFKDRFSHYLREAYKKDLVIKSIGPCNNSDKDEGRKARAEKTDIKSNFLKETSIEGIYSVRVSPLGGWLDLELHRELISFLKSLNYEPEIRLTPSQDMVLRDLSGKDAERAIELLRKIIIDNPISESIACVGGSVCRTGICNSSDAIEEVIGRVSLLPAEVQKHGFKIHISGCPSSCAQHQINAISFSGRIMNTGEKKEQGFTVYLGGSLEKFEEKARLAQKKGEILRSNLPEFIERLLELKAEADIENIDEFVRKKEAKILDILGSFAERKDI